MHCNMPFMAQIVDTSVVGKILFEAIRIPIYFSDKHDNHQLLLLLLCDSVKKMQWKGMGYGQRHVITCFLDYQTTMRQTGLANYDCASGFLFVLPFLLQYLPNDFFVVGMFLSIIGSFVKKIKSSPYSVGCCMKFK
jgi:hypothetical protein